MRQSLVRRLSRAIVIIGVMLAGTQWVLAQDDVDPNAAFILDDTAGTGFSDLPPPCGTELISIARMQWPSAVLLAQIHQIILEQEFGCEVRIVTGDLTATGSSMATTGQPAVAPELWIARIADIWNSGLEAQTMRQAGDTFAGGPLEGWFIPDFVAENHPELTSAETLTDYWQVFRAEGEARAKFISCPPDWACAIINRNLIAALGLQNLFEIVEPANRFELDTLIAGAMSRREPILFYYWQPNAVMAQFTFKSIDLGAFNAEAFTCLAQRACINPQASAYASEPVVIAMAEWVFADAPQVAGYFRRAAMPLDEMNALLAWQSENAGTPEETADHFIATRREVWEPWLGRL